MRYTLDRFLRRIGRPRGAEAAAFLLLAVALTWPMAAHPGASALGHAGADGLKHLWTLAWMRREVWDNGHFPFHTDWVNYPVGIDLYPIEPLNGLLAVALPGLGLVPLANLLVLLHLWGLGLAGAYFGREVSGRDEGGWAAGALLQGSAIAACFVQLGVGELLALWWLPLGLGTLVRARRTGSAGAFLGLALCLAGATLSCFYLGFFLAVATAVWALLTLAPLRRRVLLGYAAAAGLGLLIIAPPILAFGGTWHQGEVARVGLWSWVFGAHDQPVTDPASARLEPLHLLWPLRSLDGHQEAYGGGRYLGFAALLLAGLGLRRRPREALPWVAVGLAGVVLAMGSALVWGGHELSAHGAPLWLPGRWINRALGYVAQPMNFPVRALAITTTALAGLGALGARGRWFWLAPLAVLEVGLLQEIRRPWRTFSPEDASALQPVAEHRGHGLVDLALIWRPDAENRASALSSQMVHGHPIQAVPIERVEYFARDGARFVATLDLVEDLEPLYHRLPVGLRQPVDAYRGDLALLREAGFQELLVNYRGGRERIPDGLVEALDAVCGAPLVLGPSRGLWPVPEIQATEAERAQWRDAHQRAMDAWRPAQLAPGPSW